MSTAPNAKPPQTEEFPKALLDLVTALAKLPPEYRMTVDPVLLKVVESTRRRRRILSLVQEALGQLRLDMKYLMFDLEATRRERDEYREQIEGNE